MKKTLTLLACLVMAMSISARSYVAVADTGYVAPGDTAEVTDPITPPIIDEGEVVDTTNQKEFTLNAEKVKLRVLIACFINYVISSDFVSVYNNLIVALCHCNEC